MTTPPLRTGLDDAPPLPSNSTLRTALGRMWDYCTSTIGDGTATAGNRNRLINGNFQVNQRNKSGTVVLAAGAYGHDRWKAGASGCTYTFATVGIDTTITITAGSLQQIVEGASIEGGIYRLSHAGSAQARVVVNNAIPSGLYAATPLTSISATGGQNVTVEFTTGTVSKVQLEPGSIATIFARRPFGVEFALCQRYYQVVGRMSGSGNGNAGNVFNFSSVILPMRGTPTWGIGGLSAANCGVVPSAAGVNYVSVNATVVATGVYLFDLFGIAEAEL